MNRDEHDPQHMAGCTRWKGYRDCSCGRLGWERYEQVNTTAEDTTMTTTTNRRPVTTGVVTRCNISGTGCNGRIVAHIVTQAGTDRFRDATCRTHLESYALPLLYRGGSITIESIR